MSVVRVAATGKSEKGYAVLIETEKAIFVLTPADLLAHNTAAKAKGELERQIAASKEAVPPVFVHKNRDGSLAVAVGVEPVTWPEDWDFMIQAKADG